MSRLPSAALIGTCVGFCAWAVLLVGMLAFHGDWQGVLRVALPALLLSLGLWLVFTAVMVGAGAVFGDRRGPALQATVGALLVALAVLLWFAAAVVLPYLHVNQAYRDALQSTGSVAEVPEWLPWLCCLVGVVLLARPVLRMASAPRGPAG